VTDKSTIYKKLTMLRMYGESSRYHSEMISGVSRLDEIQAAILRVKLKYLDIWNTKRAEIAEFYHDALRGVGDVSFLEQNVTGRKSMKRIFEAKSCHHLFVIRTKKRDQLQEYLLKHDVGCGIHYPVTVNETSAFKHLGYKKGEFPEAEAQAREVLSLPIYPELDLKEAETVVATVKRFFGKI
jgi:dTDP-4-amino-4,6-dideoxygalactose transaminase